MNSFVWTLSIVLMVCGGISLAASLASRSYAEKRQKYRGKAVATVVEIVVDEPDRKGKEKAAEKKENGDPRHTKSSQTQKDHCKQIFHLLPNQNLKVRHRAYLY